MHKLKDHGKLAGVMSKLKAGQTYLRWIPAKLSMCNSPDTLIVGAQKAGTTALFSTLMQHPLLGSGNWKELHYFSEDSIYNSRDHAWYHAKFPLRWGTPAGMHFIDATPRYCTSLEYLERIRDYNSNMNVIFMMREPAARAFSHWSMQNRRKPNTSKFPHDPMPFDQAIAENFERLASGKVDERFNYIERGLYLQTLKNILQCFPKEQVLAIQNNEIKSLSEESSRQIQDFIGVPYVPLNRIDRNQNTNKSVPNPRTMCLLKEYFEPHNKALFDYLNVPMNWS